MSTVAHAPDGRRYTEVAQHLHWLTPPIVATQVVIAWVRLMYLVLFAMPISGYVMSAMEPYGVSFWGLPLPKLPKVEVIHKLAETGHYAAQWALYLLVLLHLAAAAFHVAVRRDGLLQRMIPAQVSADPD